MKRFLPHSFRFLFSALLIAAGAPALSAGEVKGTVIVPREDRRPQPRRYFKGPRRSGHAHGVVQDGPRNVVVYLPDLKSPGTPPPGRPAPVMRQVNERFVPHVLAVAKGQSVSFPNEDDFYHNVFSVVSGDRFDLGRYASGDRAASPFQTPGVVVVRCEIHPRMKAYILVLETEAYTIPSDSGTFAFPGLPAGRHRVVAWHPRHGTWEGVAEVPQDGDVSLTIAF